MNEHGIFARAARSDERDGRTEQDGRVLFAEDEPGERRLVATGETLLVPLDDCAIPARKEEEAQNSPTAKIRSEAPRS